MAMTGPHPHFSIVQQCNLLKIPRSTLYYKPKAANDNALGLMRRLDELHMKWPFYGSRKLTRELRGEGYKINRKKIQRLMKLMGIQALYQKPNTSRKHPDHKIYPYLLRDLVIDRANQVWCADITYIPMAKGFVYLVAIMDWYSRHVLSWRLSITMETEFCVDALQEALNKYGKPEIFNTDQGVQFTSSAFVETLTTQGVRVSMDGKGRFLDNIFIERLWRSLKYEDVYLKAYTSVADARANIGAWMSFYNGKRKHQALGYRTPGEFFVASRACGYVDNARKSVAHIPTGTTTTEERDSNDGRKVVGSGIELLAA